MPADVVTTINSNVNAILAKPEFTEKLLRIGAEKTGGSPDDFRKFITGEIEKWSELVRSNGLPKIQY